MNCPNCGNIVEDNVNFCMNCGTKVSGTTQPEVAAQQMMGGMTQQPQQMMGGMYQQPQPMMAPVYQQPANTVSSGKAASNKNIASITVALLLAVTVIAVIVALKPLYYYTQSYVGGVYVNNATLMRYIQMEDPDGELDGILKILCFAVAGVYLVSMLINLSVAKKAKNISEKPATGKSFFAMVFAGAASGFLLFFDTFTKEEIGGRYDDMGKFNIYNVFIILAIAVVIMVVINFFATIGAKSKWKNNGFNR